MIAALRGTVAGRTGSAVVIDVQGVGYLVHTSARTLAALGPVDAPVRLVVVTQVREDAITLFGFLDDEERDVFLLLTGVQGVGPRIALALLSALGANGTLAALAGGDRAALVRADGVGPKLAVRMLSELTGKATAMAPAPAGATPVVEDADVISALSRLGFSRAEAGQWLEAARHCVPAPVGVAALVGACLRLAGAAKAG